MTRSLLAVVSTSLITLQGCGTGVDTPDVGAYQQSVAALQAAVASHQDDSALTTTPEDCTAEHHRYEARTGEPLATMTNLSVGMDSCRRGMGQAGPFEMSSMCGSMRQELERHAATPCTADAATNHAEASRHCQMMREWLGRQLTQINSIGTGPRAMGGRHCSR